MSIFKKIKKEKKKRFEGISETQIRKDLEFMIRGVLEVLEAFVSGSQLKIGGTLYSKHKRFQNIVKTYGFQKKLDQLFNKVAENEELSEELKTLLETYGTDDG